MATYQDALAQYNEKLQSAVDELKKVYVPGANYQQIQPALSKVQAFVDPKYAGSVEGLAAQNRLNELTQRGGFADIGGEYWNGKGGSSYERMQNALGAYGGVDPSKGYTDNLGRQVAGDPNFWKTHDAELARINNIFSQAGVATVDDPFANVRNGGVTKVAAPALTAQDIVANNAAPAGTSQLPSTASTTVIPGTNTALPTFTQQQLDAAKSAGQPSGTVTAATVSSPTSTPTSYSIVLNDKGGYDLKSSAGNVVFSGKSVQDVQNIIKGTGWTTPFSISTPSGTFDASKLGGGVGSTLDMPKASGGAMPDSTDAFVQSLKALGVSGSIADSIGTTDPTIKTLQDKQISLEQTLTDNMNKLANYSSSLSAEEAKQGIPANTQALKDLRLQIQQKTAEYDAAAAKNRERSPGENISLGLIQGEDARIQRARAIEIGMLSAKEQALQGNIELSQQLAKRAVDLEYDPIKQQIENAKTFLELNKDKLTAAEKKQADKTKALLDIQKEATDAAQKEKQMKLDYSYDMMKKYGDAGILPTDTPAQIQSKLKGSRIYAQETRLASGTGAGGGGGTTPVALPNGRVVNLSALAASVIDNPALLANFTPTEKGKILKEIVAAGVDTSKLTLEKLNAGQKDTIDNYDTLIREANLANTILETGLKTGPYETRKQQALAIVGKAPEYTQYNSALSNFNSILLRLRSGAAVTPQEYDRIKGFIPLNTDPTATAKTKMEQFIAEVNAAQKNYVTRATQTSSQIVDSVINNGVTVRSPDGKLYTFPNQAAASEFKKAAGIN